MIRQRSSRSSKCAAIRGVPARGLGLALALLPLVATVAPSQVNRIVLRVNDEIATLYDYEKLKSEQLAALAQADLPPERKQEIAARIGEETMRQLFEEMLITSRAAQLGVVIREETVDAAVRNAMQGFGIDSLEEFEAGLRQSGMTLEGYREQMRKSLIVREVMGREVQERVALEEEDLRRYYRAHSEEFRKPRRVQLREIVVLDDSGLGEAEQGELAERLLAAIRDGSIDELLATTQEDGRTTGWIDLGWVLAGDLDPQLETVVADLGAGEVSAATRARGGLHLLQAIEVEESYIPEFQDVRDEIETRERNRLFDQESRSYMEELVASSYIDSQPPPEAAGFQPRPAPQTAAPTGIEEDSGGGESGG